MPWAVLPGKALIGPRRSRNGPGTFCSENVAVIRSDGTGATPRSRVIFFVLLVRYLSLQLATAGGSVSGEQWADGCCRCSWL